jgi:uncharacterized membrane protein
VCGWVLCGAYHADGCSGSVVNSVLVALSLMAASAPVIYGNGIMDKPALSGPRLLVADSDVNSLGGSSVRGPSSLTVCNKSSQERIYVALAYSDNGPFIVKGWYPLDRNQCSKLIAVNRPEKVYYYAETSDRRFAWSGGANASAWCVDEQKFSRSWDPVTKKWSSPCSRQVPFKSYTNGKYGSASLSLTD